MGFYIETDGNFDKARKIANANNGKVVNNSSDAMNALKNGEGVVVVVSNGLFEAAAFAYDVKEFEAFHSPDDLRPKQYVIMDRSLAEQLSHYRKR